jgi:hypothetical protein
VSRIEHPVSLLLYSHPQRLRSRAEPKARESGTHPAHTPVV